MARPKPAGATKHLQIDIGLRPFERLQKLRESTEVSRYGDVIADALRLDESVIENALDGNEVLARTSDGTEIPYRIKI